jgi:hypothetical protein
MTLALAKQHGRPGISAGLLADMSLRRKVRRREGDFRIIDPEPGTPATIRGVIYSLRVGQAVVLQLGWTEDVVKCRAKLYQDRYRGSTSRFVTRSHGRLLVVLRVD